MTQTLLADAFEAIILNNKAEQTVKESFIIVNYSEKALAVMKARTAKSQR